jgi:hypothetical protein
MPTLSPSAPKFFRSDLQAYEAVLRTAGAVLHPDPTDGFQGLDPTILPQVQTTYANLCSYGWANGWLVP